MSGLTCSHCGGPRHFRLGLKCPACRTYLDRPCTCRHQVGCRLARFAATGHAWVQTYQGSRVFSVWLRFSSTDCTWRRWDYLDGQLLRTVCPTAYRGETPPEDYPNELLPKDRYRLVATTP